MRWRTLSLLAIVLLLLHPSTAAVGRKAWWSRRAAKPSKRTKQAGRDKPPLRLSQDLCRILYVATAINPVISTCANRYTGVWLRRRSQGSSAPAVDQIYRKLFYFARLKPRLLYVIGACLRALQQCTVLHFVFDPSIGVGAGLNLLARMCCSQWPAPLVLGWASSKRLWLALGAQPPLHQPRAMPISVGGWW
jgi:hypothetical protein